MKKSDKSRVHLKFLWQYTLEAILLVIGILVLLFGFNDKTNKSICYSEDNSLNYKVFLKDNNYFATKDNKLKIDLQTLIEEKYLI